MPDRVVRILCRAAGQKDRIITLRPGWFERLDYDNGDGKWVYPPSVGIMILEDADGNDLSVPGIHIDPQGAPVVEQADLLEALRDA